MARAGWRGRAGEDRRTPGAPASDLGAAPLGVNPSQPLCCDLCLNRAAVQGFWRRIGGVRIAGRRMRKTRRRWSCWLVILSAIVPAGCQGSSGGPRPATASFPGISLAVGAFDDTAILAGVTAQRGEWNASRGGEISIQEQPLS